MISFAQNFEDVILARVFQGRSTGFYVDVGAGDPVTMSVTKWFYDQGWSGINVEPNKTLFDRLSRARARDINLNCGVGSERGRATFWETPMAELSTFDDKVHAAAKANAGGAATEVNIFTLSEIIDQHAAGRQIDFLKIDVEGWEYNALQGLDLERHRPLVMVIEAVFPETRVETHSQWEQLITARGYKNVYFDGLNRFYLAEEFEHLADHFLLPPNVFDDFRINNPLFDQLQSDREQHLGMLKGLQVELERCEKDRAHRLDGALTMAAAVKRLQDDNLTLTDTITRFQAELEICEKDRAHRLDDVLTLTAAVKRLQDDNLTLMDTVTRLQVEIERCEKDREQQSKDAALATTSGSGANDPHDAPDAGLVMYRRFLSQKARAVVRRLRLPPVPAEEKERDFALCVELLYRRYLGRGAEPDGLRGHVGSLRNGMRLSTLAHTIENSPEALERRQRRLPFDALSDGEIVVALAEFLFQSRGALPEEVEHWKKFLADDRDKRMQLLRGAADVVLAKGTKVDQSKNDPYRCWIMGTDRILTLADWENKAKELSLVPSKARQPGVEPSRPGFRHSGEYVVSAIASLYKGRRYIERFLQNITTQTLFDRSELIIIDADSPEGEEQIIAAYQRTFPNIVYKRINYRIGVYDAWNVGVEISRGRYLTNTNVDDLRRHDSFELQASTLDRYKFIDVVYQDFFYTLDGSLSFDDIEKFGFKSELPIVTPHNLLKFNSPHNAPMWRRALHDQLGPFDTSYKSAGDWEFWLRCLSNGKTFLKINAPHIAYFHNPEGISTRPDTRGVEEGHRAALSYSNKLISPELRLSREALADTLMTQVDWDVTTSHYDVVQRELNRLGARFRKEIETSDPS